MNIVMLEFDEWFGQISCWFCFGHYLNRRL